MREVLDTILIRLLTGACERPQRTRRQKLFPLRRARRIWSFLGIRGAKPIVVTCENEPGNRRTVIGQLFEILEFLGLDTGGDGSTDLRRAHWVSVFGFSMLTLKTIMSSIGGRFI